MVCLTTHMVSGICKINNIGLVIGLFTCVHKVNVQNMVNPRYECVWDTYQKQNID